MKIGILTFHCANNYGAVLQTLGLSEKLTDLYQSHEVYIVNYCPASIIKVYSLLKYGNMYSLISSISQLPFSMKRKHNFNKFRKENFNLLSFKDIGCLDYLICGSDQIWNPVLTNELDPNYFGLIEGFKGRTIAYAASDGGNLKKSNPAITHSYLSNIAFISVRESSMIPSLSAYSKDVSVVLDPVFLPDSTFWHAFSLKQKYTNYVLVYKLSDNDEIVRNACQFAEKTGKKVIEIAYKFPYKQMLTKKHTVLSSIGIAEFVSLFLYADFVFTNSFHGTAFSILFNKCFYTYTINDKRANRIVDLLSALSLMDQYVSSVDVNMHKEIDYRSVNMLLYKKKEASLNFIKRSLSLQ
ncbi:hypothetical protein FACS189493_6110 [Spirochaetia bacterium]|nr:hypothetical protein FACS189493_6110 [Spirochaetia bacterium]